METENDTLIIDNDTRLNEEAVEEARRFLEGEYIADNDNDAANGRV